MTPPLGSAPPEPRVEAPHTDPFAARAWWRARASQSLSPPDQVRQRNADISAAYAGLYLRAPTLLKWAGMAAFASHHAGVGLVPLQGAGRPWWRFWPRRSGVELIRETNDAIFESLGWAHFAFLDGGYDEVHRIVRRLPGHTQMRNGFSLLRDAQWKMEHGATTAAVADAVWEANRLLLWHEQLNTVQPRFAAFSWSFEAFLSSVAELDFDADNWAIDHATSSRFTLFMLSHGARILLGPPPSWPDIGNFEHRWHWIEHRLLPTWRRVEETDPKLRDKMERLRQAPDPLR